MKFLHSASKVFIYTSFVPCVEGQSTKSPTISSSKAPTMSTPSPTLAPTSAPTPAPIQPDPCRNNTCNNAGVCTVVDGSALCVCENTFEHNANRDGCVCPEGTTLDIGSNRCFGPPTSSPTGIVPIVTGSPTSVPSSAPVIPADSCQDNTLFQFTLRNTGNIVGCDWLTTNQRRTDIRKSNYCDRADVFGACQSSCDNCQCGDDPDFTFMLPNTNEVVSCSYINRNPNRIIRRRNNLCYADDKCREASSIGEACAAACGFCDGTSTVSCIML